MILKDKVVLITGGSRGIGENIVKRMAAEGAKVAFTYLNSAEKANQICAEIGTNIKAYQSNAASFAEAEKLINDVLADFGGIDVLINNAGITRDNLILRMNEQQWDDVISNNLKSIFNLSKFVVKPMLRKGGSIINISSIVGITGNAGQSNYAASKAGVIGFTKSLAKELGSRNIRCNAIAPGFISTDMTHALGDAAQTKFLENIALKRLGEGKEIADVCLFLASDMSSYITGQTISVCGGLNI
jgi:3-oxoacyl-[acyl-carrier protein] reductase